MVGRDHFGHALPQEIVPLRGVLQIQPKLALMLIDEGEGFPVVFVAHDGPIGVAERVIFDDM